MNSKFLSVFLLFMVVDLYSCANDADDDRVVRPVKQSDTEISKFFDTALPPFKTSSTFFVGEETNRCVIINAYDDLASISADKTDLPVVDYTNCSLVIGQVILPTSFYKIAKKELIRIDKTYHLKLWIEPYSENSSWQAISHLYFWDFYPKLETNNIILDVVLTDKISIK